MKLFLHIAILASLAGSCFGAEHPQDVVTGPASLPLAVEQFLDNAMKLSHEQREAELNSMESHIEGADLPEYIKKDHKLFYTLSYCFKLLKEELTLLPLIKSPTNENDLNLAIQNNKAQLAGTRNSLLPVIDRYTRACSLSGRYFAMRLIFYILVARLIWGIYQAWQNAHTENENPAESIAQEDISFKEWFVTWIKNNKVDIGLVTVSVIIALAGELYDNKQAERVKQILLEKYTLPELAASPTIPLP
ncbi:MAG: hypothetical protein WCT20_02815 [Candidatus Babeliales bacterium]